MARAHSTIAARAQSHGSDCNPKIQSPNARSDTRSPRSVSDASTCIATTRPISFGEIFSLFMLGRLTCFVTLSDLKIVTIIISVSVPHRRCSTLRTGISIRWDLRLSPLREVAVRWTARLGHTLSPLGRVNQPAAYAWSNVSTRGAE